MVLRRLSFAVQLVAILLLAVSASAQGVGGGIVGTVTGPAPGRAARRDGHRHRPRPDGIAQRRHRGRRHLSASEPAAGQRLHVLVFELPGFGGLKREGIRLDVGFTATINATLSPASLEETVTVSGASPVVDVTASRVSTHLNAEQIATVLVGSRDYAAVMAQVPGVLNTRVDVGGD